MALINQPENTFQPCLLSRYCLGGRESVTMVCWKVYFFMMCSIYIFLGDWVKTHSLWALWKFFSQIFCTTQTQPLHKPAVIFNISTQGRKTHRPVTSGVFRLNVLQMKLCPGIRHVLGFLNSMFPGFLKKSQTGTLFIISSSSQNQQFLEHIRIPMLWRCATTQPPKALLRAGTRQYQRPL